MFEGIQGKRVLITGATGGIGSAIATLFAEYGAKLGLQYRTNRKEALRLTNDLRKMTKAEAFRTDLLNTKQRDNLIASFKKKFGGIDILINNAGAANDYVDFGKLKERSFDGTFGLNVKVPFYLSGKAFGLMEKQGGGKIINISSVNVKYGGSAKSMPYVASKMALESITKGFSREGAKHNILVNAIRPGLIDTPMRNRVAGYTEKNFAERMALVPLGRAGTPLDVARMALFLAAETGDFITGEIFTVAGGD